MLLTCPKCKTKNFLDPYPFWNFKGKTKCAGCNAIWQIQTTGGIPAGAPTEGSGNADLLPGFAERQDYSPISGPGLTRPAPRARKDAVCKPIPIKQNVRGKIIAGYPLKKEDLVGSKAKFMVAGAR